MPEMAAVLPEVTQAVVGTVDATDAQPAQVDPQAHGWTAKTQYNYEMYNKSGKELMAAASELPVGAEAGDLNANVMGVESGAWASTAPVYDFDPEEMGDIGPKHPELEKMLFGGDNAGKTGINFSK
jgi:ATP-dependent RNA helicase DDX3X